MKKKFKLKGTDLWISSEDIVRTARRLPGGVNDRVRFYAVVEENKYPIRMLAEEAIKLLGKTIPDITTHQAINVIRSLGFEIFEART